LDDVARIANDLARWLVQKAGVTGVQPPVTALQSAARLRAPFRRSETSQPAFELHFAYKGSGRCFRYFIENFDDPESVCNILRVHTNGELLVVVPDKYGNPLPNAIYYGNRSVAGAAYGNPVSRS
jgi:hypothetical protein